MPDHEVDIAGRDPQATGICGLRPALLEVSLMPITPMVSNLENDIDYDRLQLLVREWIKPIGTVSARALSLQASDGKNADLIRNFLVKGTKPSWSSVWGICKAIGVSPTVVSIILDEAFPVRGDWIPVIGAVEAGAWREKGSWPESDHYEIEVDQIREQIYDFALIVRDSSMGKIAPPGTILRCADTYSWAEGDFAIVRRTNGSLVEITCRRMSIGADGGWELNFESNNPGLQAPVSLGEWVEGEWGPEFQGEKAGEISVRAKVLDGYLSIRKRRTRPPRKRDVSRIL